MLAGNASTKCLSGAGWRASVAQRGCLSSSAGVLRWMTLGQHAGAGERPAVGCVRSCGCVGTKDSFKIASSSPLRRYMWRATSSLAGVAAKDDSAVSASAAVTSNVRDDVLAAVSRRARQIAGMESKPALVNSMESESTETSTTEVSSARATISAAEELLELTSSASLAEALAPLEKTDEAPPECSSVASDANRLHSALFSVASRLCSFGDDSKKLAVSEDDDAEEGERLVSLAMDLAHRSAELGLPLHRPLCADVAALAASRSGQPVAGLEGAAASRILDAASVARTSLHPDHAVPSSFFSRALIALVQRGLLRDAIEVIQCMGTDEVGMLDVELDAGMEMLGTIADDLLVDGKLPTVPSIKRRHAEAKRGVEQCIRSGDMARAAEIKRTALMPLREVLEQRCDRSADAMELALMLRGPILRQLSMASTRRLGNINSILSTLGGAGDDGEDSDSEMDAEEAAADLTSLCEAVDAFLLGGESGESDDVVISTGFLVSPAEEGNSDSEDDSVDPWESISPEAEAAIKKLRSAEMERDEAEVGVGLDFVVEQLGSTPQHSVDVQSNEPSFLERIAEDMIYIRDGPAWNIPDLIDDLKRWSSGRDIRYTREYEKFVFDEMDRDDEEYGDGNDEGLDDDDDL